MWPSMVQPSLSSSGSVSKRKSRARELLDWAREEEYEDGLRALVQSPINDPESDTENYSSFTNTPLPSQMKPKTSRMQKEIDEFERWLEEDESQRVNEDPWARRDEFGSPPATESCSGVKTPTMETFLGSGTGSGDVDHRFEDDFTDFVVAPMDHEIRTLESNSTKGHSYMSLDSEFDTIDDEDTDLPSQDEIQATTRRIFGSTPFHLPKPTSESKQQFPSSTEISGIGASPAPSTSTLGDEDDSGFSRFDLSRVFSALQVMKEEVSEISDDGERRKAAARVALGLVYGLQSDEDTDV